jgi:hypothetical protein
LRWIDVEPFRLVPWVWAAVGAAMVLVALPSVTSDPRLLVGAASVVGPVAALAGSFAIARRQDRRAATMLIALELVTPTYFARP